MAPSVLNDRRTTTTRKAQLWLNGDEIASCERKFDERVGGRTLTNRKERTGIKGERRKSSRSSPGLQRNCRGYEKDNAMTTEYFPLRLRTNKSALVSGFYNWPEVVQLRKRDAGRPPRESSFARPSLSFFSSSYNAFYILSIPSVPNLFAWLFYYGRRRRADFTFPFETVTLKTIDYNLFFRDSDRKLDIQNINILICKLLILIKVWRIIFRIYVNKYVKIRVLNNLCHSILCK